MKLTFLPVVLSVAFCSQVQAVVPVKTSIDVQAEISTAVIFMLMARMSPINLSVSI
ncbi:Uncharacterised protein [Escherichia coli]|nr:Uncharacterised protein [Escherichia coli]